MIFEFGARNKWVSLKKLNIFLYVLARRDVQ